MRDRIVIITGDTQVEPRFRTPLEAAGYEVQTSRQAHDGLALIERWLPAVIILALTLPDSDAPSLCLKLSQTESTRTIPMLVLAPPGETGQTNPCLGAGATGFLADDCAPADLLAHIRSLARISRRFHELNAAHRMREDMCQMLAHDLRGNLCVLQMTNDYIKRHANNETLGPVLTQTEEITRDMNVLLNEMLVEAKAAGDSLRPRLDRHRIAPVIRQSVDKHRFPAASRDVVIQALFNDTDPHEIHGDSRLLGRVVDNLLANAIRHSPVGGTVKVTLEDEGGQISLAVCDQGAGVPNEHKELIFRKFFSQQNPAHSQESPPAGTGLGLTFCRLVVEAHGGTIQVHDNEDGGAKFVTRLNKATRHS